MITKTEAIAELFALQADLAKYGRCVSQTGDCAYVQDDHPGCAIGRRMTEDEKDYVMEQGDYVNECTNVEGLADDGCMPRFFEDWNIALLRLLQEVHDSYNPENTSYIGKVRKYFRYVEDGNLNREEEYDHDNR